MEKIRIKYLTDIEKLERHGDWVDLRAAEDVFLQRGEFKKIRLGIAVELPNGYEAHVLPRSSTFDKFGIIMTNSEGIIDNSYCGDKDEWMFPAYCLEPRDGEVTEIKKGDRICQMRIVENMPQIEFEEVDILGNSDRGGFGSSGR